MNLLGQKSFLSATLLFQITNSQVLVTKYNFTNCNKLMGSIEQLPHDCREQFQFIVAESHLLARTALQASLDAAHYCQLYLHSNSYAQGVMAPTFWVSRQVSEHSRGRPYWS